VGKTGKNVLDVLKNTETNILAGIICSCYNQQRWAKQGKNVLDVLNRATYLQLLHISSCLKGGHNRKRM
jgi:hypothetical protein